MSPPVQALSRRHGTRMSSITAPRPRYDSSAPQGHQPELKAEGDSHCTIELEPIGTAVKLAITHTIEREPSKFIIGRVAEDYLEFEVSAGDRCDRPAGSVPAAKG